MKYLNILLQKNDSNVPWGFHLTGGQQMPLTIKHVSSGTIASNHLSVGDVIVSIGHQPVDNMKFSEANDVITSAANELQLLVLNQHILVDKTNNNCHGLAICRPLEDYRE
ncbi:hypothetical protein CHUAL_009184 [Chamberlinius hualienensis]